MKKQLLIMALTLVGLSIEGQLFGKLTEAGEKCKKECYEAYSLLPEEAIQKCITECLENAPGDKSI